MRGFHFSLRWLFGTVSFLAVGCGLLVYASPMLSKLTATLTVILLLAAVPAAVYHAANRRAFCAGFAFFGFAYLWMVCGTWQSHDGSNFFRERLVTTDLLSRFYGVLPSSQANLLPVGVAYPEAYPPAYSVQSVIIDPATNLPAAPTNPAPDPTEQYASASSPALVASPAATSGVDWADFMATGHSLFAILLAFLGGAITRRCRSRSRALYTDPGQT